MDKEKRSTPPEVEETRGRASEEIFRREELAIGAERNHRQQTRNISWLHIAPPMA